MVFGSAVGFVGPDPLVGAVNDSSRALFEGGAYLFDRSTGALRATLHAPVPQAGSGFGSRVGEIGGQPVVAAVFDDLAGPHAGAIYLFDTSGEVVRSFPNPAGDQVRPSSSYSGQVTLDAIDDRLLAAGFYEYRGGSVADSDSVYVIDTQTGDVLQTLVAPDPFGTHLAASYVIATKERIVVSGFGQLFVFDPVGNGYVDSSEQCDDGNTANGDGCSSHGLLEAPGCPLVPRSDCAPALPGRAHLLVRNAADARRRLLSWRMRSAGGTVGDPMATTGYRVCIYDGAGAIRSRRSFTLPAGGQCGRRACWQARSGGFSYRDPARVADGIAGAMLRRTGGSVALDVRVQGTNAVLPVSPFDVPVQVQLSRLDDGECWTSTFSRPGRNAPSGFSARGD
jgi:cysteine-rich repeat protein